MTALQLYKRLMVTLTLVGDWQDAELLSLVLVVARGASFVGWSAWTLHHCLCCSYHGTSAWSCLFTSRSLVVQYVCYFSDDNAMQFFSVLYMGHYPYHALFCCQCSFQSRDWRPILSSSLGLSPSVQYQRASLSAVSTQLLVRVAVGVCTSQFRHWLEILWLVNYSRHYMRLFLYPAVDGLNKLSESPKASNVHDRPFRHGPRVRRRTGVKLLICAERYVSISVTYKFVAMCICEIWLYRTIGIL